MNPTATIARLLPGTAALACAIAVFAQTDPGAPPTANGFPPTPGGPGFGGPPGFGPGGPGGPGMMPDRKVLKQFDKNNNRRLEAEERKEARACLAKEGGNRGPGGPPGGGRRGGPGAGQQPAQPGAKVSPADVPPVPNATLYDPKVLRTFFLDFEESDWEQELEEFHGTDVDVPAKLTVDGTTYHDVGVRFRGMTSYMSVPTGRKRPLNLSVDYAHDKQAVMGYRTLNLLNSCEDPTFLRTVLYFGIARTYLAAPKANYVRLVVNGENWGVYVNVQQFNKDFTEEWFGEKNGARGKVPGSPGGRGSLAYLGDDPEAYKKIYEIKSKDEPEAWAALIRLCKTLDETPPDKLQEALAPRLDIDGALKFLALENALVNNDGYWIRCSDYNLYLDKAGRFHIIPYDANETFGASPGGPGGPGGPGFGPGGMLAMTMLGQADTDGDGMLAGSEFAALAASWWAKLDPGKTGRLDAGQFAAKAGELVPPPPAAEGFRPPPDAGEHGPGRFLASVLFPAFDADRDQTLTADEMRSTFTRWFNEWDQPQSGSLDREKLQAGLAKALPRPDRGGPGGPPGGPGGPGMGGGVKLDPLAMANNESKPLISKLLAVPALRQRYIELVREIATKWLDWDKLGPMARQHQDLIRDAVNADTRKLDSFEAFLAGLEGAQPAGEARGPGGGSSIKDFAAQRRAFLLADPAPAQATAYPPGHP